MASIANAAASGNGGVPSGVDWALHAAHAGWRVFPVIPGRGIPYSVEAMNAALGLPIDAPAGCRHGTTDPHAIRCMWADDRSAAWIGLTTGNGVLAVDLDEKNGKSGSATVAANGWTILPTASQPTRNAGSHHLYSVPPGTGVPTDSDMLGSGVDRRGDGGFIILYDPIILSAARAPAPAWALSGGRAKANRLDVADAKRAPSYKMALDALRSRDPAEMDRHEWLAFSGAFYASTAGLADDATALADWQEWNAPHGDTNDPAANTRTWSDFRRNSTAGDFHVLTRMGEDANAKGWAAFGGAAPPLPAGARATLPRAANDDPGAFFVRVADMVSRPPVFLIDGLLEEDALASLFGDPASGKSLVAIDMAASVATGEAFHGHNVAAGPVFYIAGEGLNGLRRRWSAWEELRGRSLGDAPLFSSRAAVQFLDGQSVTTAVAAIDALAVQHGAPRLIVIDTLARNFGPGDENSTADMNRFVAALDKLLERYAGSTVLLVHHSGHGDKARGRGSSVLRGAVDTEYRVEKKDGVAVLSNSKMKDAPPPRAMRFDMVEAAGSVALEYMGEPAATGGGLAPMPQLAFDTFNAVAMDGAADVETWRAAFYERHTSDKPDTKKRAFLDARKLLVKGGYLTAGNSDQIYSRPQMPGSMPDR